MKKRLAVARGELEDDPMGAKSRLVRMSAVIGMAVAATGTAAGQFMPPAGYSSGPPGPGHPQPPGVFTPAEPGSPALVRVPDASLSTLFQIDPSYRRASQAQLKVVGAFQIVEAPGVHATGAWAPGFLPVLLSFSDGRCFSLSADYNNGILSQGRLQRAACEHRNIPEQPTPPPPPGRQLRGLRSSWGHGAWVDDRSHTTIVTAPFQKAFEPLFTAHMDVISMLAMDGPDYPGGNVTLVGRLNGKLTVVTLEVSW